MSESIQIGPVYSCVLLSQLPMTYRGKSNQGIELIQAMPGREELKQVRKISERTVAAYEVLTSHHHAMRSHISQLEKEVKELRQELSE